MVKKRKASYRKTAQVTDLPLNEEAIPEEVSEEKVDPVVKQEIEMENQIPDVLDQIDDQIPETQPKEEFGTNSGEEIPVSPLDQETNSGKEEFVTNSGEDTGAGTGLPIPQNTVRFRDQPVKPTVTHVAPRPTVTSHPKVQPESNTLRYAIIAGGALMGIIVLYLLFFSGGKKKAQGPTIVEVTEVKEERKSEKDSAVNNKMSSPRIIFGDLRRNPALAVAPTVQQ